MRADRREFLRDSLWTMSTLMGSPGLLAAAREEPARSLPAGVHLFLDSGLIAEERNLRRVIHPPTRLPRADRDRGRGQVLPAVRQRAPRPADQAVPDVVQHRRRRHAVPHRLPGIGGRRPLHPPASRARGPERPPGRIRRLRRRRRARFRRPGPSLQARVGERRPVHRHLARRAEVDGLEQDAGAQGHRRHRRRSAAIRSEGATC